MINFNEHHISGEVQGGAEVLMQKKSRRGALSSSIVSRRIIKEKGIDYLTVYDEGWTCYPALVCASCGKQAYYYRRDDDSSMWGCRGCGFITEKVDIFFRLAPGTAAKAGKGEA